jgi:hexosaminidase
VIRIIALLAALACLASQPVGIPLPTVIPEPAAISISIDGPPLVLDGPFEVVAGPGDADLAAAAGVINDLLARNPGLARGRSPRDRPSLRFQRPRPGGPEKPESYRLVIAAHDVLVEASSGAGAFYAMQTLRQLLPADVERGTAASPVSLRPLEFTDAPRFSWRGALVDVGRHYLPPATLKHFIDLLAYYKLNVLHWHLTDDQGWRIAITRYPRLTSVGAWRTDADGARYGGFYTRAQVRDIVEYARRRHVTIVPEIEMPGHASAALTAYPEYSCTGETKRVPTSWGVFEDVLCPGKEETFHFIENVLDEVMAMFPSRVIHIGGDEVPKAHWMSCARCQKRMKDEGLKDAAELQSYFVRRVGEYVRSKGREITGWDEILEGGLPKGTTVQVWRDVEHTRTAVKAGARVVASPSSHTYINRSPGDLTLARVLEFDPVPPGLSAAEASLVAGGEATLWSEGIDAANLDAMAFPRLAAFAETLWAKQPVNRVGFRARLDAHYAKLAAMAVTVGPESEVLVSLVPVFDPARARVTVRTEQHVTPLEFRVTTDGTVPTLASPAFEASRWFSSTGTVRVRPFLAGKPLLTSATLTIDRHLGVGRPITFTTPNSPTYPGTGSFALTDSLRGSANFHDGTWQGWEGESMEGVVDLGAVTALRSVEVGAMQDVRSWILLPRGVAVWLSNDGTEWRAAGEVGHDVPVERADALVHRFVDRLPPGTRARYVKARAENAGPLPAWHPGAGGKAWVFVDEIAIR